MRNYRRLRYLIIVGLMCAGVMSADQLHDAAEDGDLDTPRQLLAVSPDVDAKATNSGATALILAAGKGHEASVNALLAASADVNAKTNDGRTALMLAAQNYNQESGPAVGRGWIKHP